LVDQELFKIPPDVVDVQGLVKQFRRSSELVTGWRALTPEISVKRMGIFSVDVDFLEQLEVGEIPVPRSHVSDGVGNFGAVRTWLLPAKDVAREAENNDIILVLILQYIQPWIVPRVASERSHIDHD
jgi:hypothetical protein